MDIMNVFADYFAKTFRLFFLPDTDWGSEKYRDILANESDRKKYFDAISEVKGKSGDAREQKDKKISLSTGETLVVSR